jgi:hypothetical protein
MMTKKMRNNNITAIKYILLAVFFFTPLVMTASVRISEIMYDLPGADAGREWVEIHNSGSTAVDLAGWKFFDGSNHTLNDPPKNGGRGSLVMPAGSFAILASDAEIFISEYPSYTGTVIDTVMSLNNTAGTLKLIHKEGNEIDSVSYNKEMGGAGDGDSLHRSGSNIVAGAPSPGSLNASPSNNAGGGSEDEETSNFGAVEATSPTITKENTSAKAPQIYADAGADRTIMARAGVIFSGKVYDSSKSPLPNAKVYWNMGDGTILDGQAILHAYIYPGTYTVVMHASVKGFSTTDKLVVKVIDSPIKISDIGDGADPYIKIKNDSTSDLEISLWNLRVNDKTWGIPPGTFIVKKSELIFSSKRTGLLPRTGDKIELVFPNGEVAHLWQGRETVPLVRVQSVEPEVSSAYFENEDYDLLSLAPLLEPDPEFFEADEIGFVAGNVAAVGASKSENNFLKWLVFLVGFLGLIIFFALFVLSKGKSEKIEETDDEFDPDEFEIEEELL